jgi:hypothetical protein
VAGVETAPGCFCGGKGGRVRENRLRETGRDVGAHPGEPVEAPTRLWGDLHPAFRQPEKGLLLTTPRPASRQKTA